MVNELLRNRRSREEKLAHCREVLEMAQPEPVHGEANKDYRHRYADHIAPAVDRDLAGDHERAGVVAVLDDFEQISRLIGVERFGPPIVEDAV
jgi:hypothetical protein